MKLNCFLAIILSGGGNKEGAQFFTACTEVESYFQQLLHSKSLDNILK